MIIVLTIILFMAVIGLSIALVRSTVDSVLSKEDSDNNVHEENAVETPMNRVHEQASKNLLHEQVSKDLLYESVFLSDECMEYLYQCIHDIQNILDHFGIEYWMTGGSLLGILRGGAHIPWDDDVDFEMHKDDLKRICSDDVQRVFRAHGFSAMMFNPAWPRVNGVFMFPENIFGKPLHIDFFGIERLPNGRLYSKCFRKGGIHDWDESNVYPLVDYKYGPITVKGPNNILGHINSTNYLNAEDVDNYMIFSPHCDLYSSVFSKFANQSPSPEQLKELFMQYKDRSSGYTILDTCIPNDDFENRVADFVNGNDGWDIKKNILPETDGDVDCKIVLNIDDTTWVEEGDTVIYPGDNIHMLQSLTDKKCKVIYEETDLEFYETVINELIRAKGAPIRQYEILLYKACTIAKHNDYESVQFKSLTDVSYIPNLAGLSSICQIIDMDYDIDNIHGYEIANPERLNDPFFPDEDSISDWNRLSYVTFYELLSNPKCKMTMSMSAL